MDTKRNNNSEIINDLKIQKLPGNIKSKWAIDYKLEMDKLIQDTLIVKNKKQLQNNTKGQYEI